MTGQTKEKKKKRTISFSPLCVCVRDCQPGREQLLNVCASCTNTSNRWWHGHIKTMETRTSCQPTSIAPLRTGPFKFSRCLNFAVATSLNKRVWVQTGRSLQLQDASVGGPEEGCRALFIHKRCRSSREMGIGFVAHRRSINTTSPIKVEKGAASVTAKPTKDSKFNAVCLIGKVAHLIQRSCWSPWRPLVQSDNVRSESLLVAQNQQKPQNWMTTTCLTTQL